MSAVSKTVLTAADHRRVPVNCDCKWDQPWPRKPWVLIEPNPRCRVVFHRELSQFAARQTYWQMVLDAAEAQINQAKRFAATARGQLTELGVKVPAA